MEDPGYDLVQHEVSLYDITGRTTVTFIAIFDFRIGAL